MRVVYEAEDLNLQRPVALKFLPSAISIDRPAVQAENARREKRPHRPSCPGGQGCQGSEKSGVY